MSETLGNNMHGTHMSRLLICISISRCTSGHRKQLSAEPGTQNTKCRRLSHPPTRSALRTAIPTHTWPRSCQISDPLPTHDSDPHAPALPSPSSTRASQTFARSKDHFCVVWSVPARAAMQRAMLLLGQLSVFALSSVADDVWNVVFPTLLYPHFHSTYNFRMTSSVCSQNSVYFNVLFKLLMCNK